MVNSKYKFNKYIKLFEYNTEEVILFNTVNRAILLFPNEFIKNNSLIKETPNDFIEVLQEMDFFLSEEKIKEHLDTIINNNDRLVISIETTLLCNLKCPYCYQANTLRNKNIISRSSIDDLIDYIQLVYSIQQFKVLYLKILGGEPTIHWDIIEYLLEKSSQLSRSKGFMFSLYFDTNGTNLNNILKINYIDFEAVTLNIPLSFKNEHDKYRFFNANKGSYETIIENINRIYNFNPNINIVLRHNTDHLNYLYFEEFIKDIKSNLVFIPTINVNYTVSSEKYENNLSYSGYQNWLSSQAIEIMAKNSVKIVSSPATAIEKCQYYSDYGIKLFSDGTVGACAVNFFDKDRISLRYLIDNIHEIKSFWNSAKESYPLNKKDCSTCSYIFLCGGVYYFPCVGLIEGVRCKRKGNFSVSLDSFLKVYVKYAEQDKEKLFVGFNNTELCQ